MKWYPYHKESIKEDNQMAQRPQWIQGLRRWWVISIHHKDCPWDLPQDVDGPIQSNKQEMCDDVGDNRLRFNVDVVVHVRKGGRDWWQKWSNSCNKKWLTHILPRKEMMQVWDRDAYHQCSSHVSTAWTGLPRTSRLLENKNTTGVVSCRWSRFRIKATSKTWWEWRSRGCAGSWTDGVLLVHAKRWLSKSCTWRWRRELLYTLNDMRGWLGDPMVGKECRLRVLKGVLGKRSALLRRSAFHLTLYNSAGLLYY